MIIFGIVFVLLVAFFVHFGWMALYSVAFHPFHTLVQVLLILLLYHFIRVLIDRYVAGKK